MSKVTHKTVIDKHIDNLTEGASIVIATLNRLERNIKDLKDGNSSIKNTMYSINKENLLFLEKIFAILNEQSFNKAVLYQDYSCIKQEAFTEVMQNLETITNNLIKTKTMLEGQPWI